MKKNWKKKIKNANGITLIALVITIIVLLILAGVSLSMVFNQDGLFNRAEQATDKYGQAKARETLELLLGEAEMRKYESGLTEEELNEEIEKSTFIASSCSIIFLINKHITISIKSSCLEMP